MSSLSWFLPRWTPQETIENNPGETFWFQHLLWSLRGRIFQEKSWGWRGGEEEGRGNGQCRARHGVGAWSLVFWDGGMAKSSKDENGRGFIHVFYKYYWASMSLALGITEHQTLETQWWLRRYGPEWMRRAWVKKKKKKIKMISDSGKDYEGNRIV